MFVALLLALAGAPAHAQPYAMAEAGITLDLPAGWDMTRWSDWDFRASHPAGMALEVWYSPWQIALDDTLGPALSTIYTEHLEEERAGGINVGPTTKATVGSLALVRTDTSFQFDRTGPKGVTHAAAFAGEGKVLFVAVYAPTANAARAASALDQILQRLTVDKPAVDLAPLSAPQKTNMGFTVALPAGWRVPTGAERDELMKLSSVVGAEKPADCFLAARPSLDAEAVAGMFLCKANWHMKILDEYSFDDEAAALKALLFGKAAEKIAAPTPIQTKDRTAILMKPEINGRELRLAVVPYDQGQVAAWLVGPKGSGETLDAAATATLQGLTYEGPDNGVPPFQAGAWVAHTFAYRPFHPLVLAVVAAGLLFLAGVGFLVFRKAPNRNPGYGSY
jgi:hypothetical protein